LRNWHFSLSFDAQTPQTKCFDVVADEDWEKLEKVFSFLPKLERGY
jgi:hypothetical protein